MALSLLQEAQTARGLAAVRSLAGMKLEDERNMSTPMNTDAAQNMYAGMHANSMHAQLLAAASHQTAALMALPMSLRHSLGLFSHHPALFGGWPPASSSQSPPASPISPISHSARSAKTKLTNNNHIVSTTTNDIMPKKVAKRKASSMKQAMNELHEMSHPVEIPGANMHNIMNNNNNNSLMSTGPISPPTSGSSPQSINSLDQAPVMPNNIKDPSRDKVFTCKICHRGFGYKHVLQNHERTHTGEKPFECPECHKRFTRDHHLKTHMRLHTGEKPYHCKFCERKFVQVANLRRHLRVHTGDRPYTCDLCQSKFSDSNQLKAHMLIHNGEKPFECDRCHSRFRRRHLMLHHKCGIISPPTPAISPAMSLSDMKSASSRSEVSDESMDLGKPSLHQFATLALPTYLPAETTESILDAEKRNRKSHDIRRIMRMPTPQIKHEPNDMPPMQTEPEDLSMHSPRSPVSNISHDEDLDDLDDAASLYIKSRHTHFPRKSLDA